MPLPSITHSTRNTNSAAIDSPHARGLQGSRPSVGTRAGLIGKVLLWVIGIPLLIMVFSIAAIGRGLFASHGAPPASPSSPARDGASPPAMHPGEQPRGPDPAGRTHRGVDL